MSIIAGAYADGWRRADSAHSVGLKFLN
ncbi:hypothetical protein NC652_001978 [Populus alba x Populus x berolinensis]|nr:hypothetical protein NC652_001978 [Populus alba x Populus x berolinensis]